jgi:hypothetical protein
LVTLASIALGAKCLENDSLRRDANGDWQITGEIHNETGVQGLDIELLGVVEYEDGTRMQAEATMCPDTLSPGTFSAYRVTFEGSDAYIRPSSYRVNVAGGSASPDRLHTLQGVFEVNEGLPDRPVAQLIRPGEVGVGAFFKLADSEIGRAAHLRAGYAYCAVLYGPGGDVVYVDEPRQANLSPDPTVPRGRSLFMVSRIRTAPVDAVEARILFWLLGSDGTPTSAVRMTDLLPITERVGSDF